MMKKFSFVAILLVGCLGTNHKIHQPNNKSRMSRWMIHPTKKFLSAHLKTQKRLAKGKNISKKFLHFWALHSALAELESILIRNPNVSTVSRLNSSLEVLATTYDLGSQINPIGRFTMTRVKSILIGVKLDWSKSKKYSPLSLDLAIVKRFGGVFQGITRDGFTIFRFNQDNFDIVKANLSRFKPIKKITWFTRHKLTNPEYYVPIKTMKIFFIKGKPLPTIPADKTQKIWERPDLNMIYLKFQEGIGPQDLKRVMTLPGIQYIQPNYKYFLAKPRAFID